jgi:hypothetical protein
MQYLHSFLVAASCANVGLQLLLVEMLPKLHLLLLRKTTQWNILSNFAFVTAGICNLCCRYINIGNLCCCYVSIGDFNLVTASAAISAARIVVPS